MSWRCRSAGPIAPGGRGSRPPDVLAHEPPRAKERYRPADHGGFSANGWPVADTRRNPRGAAQQQNVHRRSSAHADEA